MSQETLDSWGPIVANLIIVAAIAALALAASRVLQWPIRKMLEKNKSFKADGTVFYNIIRVFVWVTAACWIADIVFGFDMAAAFGALGVVGIAVSLGAQQTIANVIGGIIVSLSGLIGPGDWIQVGDHKEGEVVETNWRRTMLRDEDGVLVIVPNSLMVSSQVLKGNPYFMTVIPFALRPDAADVEGLLVRCEQALLDSLVNHGLDCEGKRPKAHVTGTVPGAIQCEVKLYPNRAHDDRHVKRAVLPALVGLLQDEGALAEFPALEPRSNARE